MVDAHVVAVCVLTGRGLVVTTDPDNIAALAGAVPAARIRGAHPDSLASEVRSNLMAQLTAVPPKVDRS
jgi:hypothetical protein